jgi:hypothetical protein
MNEHKTEAETADSSTRRRLEQYLPEVVRRTLVAGLGAVLMTEEGLRGALSDLKLPKEAIAYLAAQADRSKRELSNAIARELRSFLDGVDLSRVLRRVLAGMTLEFTTQVKFIPNDATAEREEAGPVAVTTKSGKSRRRPRSAGRQRPASAGTDNDEENK